MLSVILSGCGGGSSATPIGDATTAPTVISTNPDNNVTAVVRNQSIAATFSTAMDAATINTTTFTVTGPGTTSVAGVVTYSGTTAVFNPTTDLDSTVLYTATITTGAKNVARTPMAANHVWTFTTGSATDNTAPTVLSTNPADNNTTTGVSSSQNITVIFSEALDPTTVTGTTFKVTGPGTTAVDGNVSYVGTTATFNPTSNLVASTLYTATLTTGITDIAGNPLAVNHVWTFTTGSGIIAANPTAPVLGEAGRYVILASQYITGGAGSTLSNGDIAVMDQARTYMTGFTPTNSPADGLFNQLTGYTWGTELSRSYASDDLTPNFPLPLAYAAPHTAYPTTLAMINQSRTDLGVAYTFLAADPNPGAPTQVCPIELGNQTLTRGVYKTASNVSLTTGTLHLDAQGDANAIWIFSIDGTFTTGAPGGSIDFVGGVGSAKNVYWRVAGVTTIGAGTTFYGNVFGQANVDVLSGANITGSLFSKTASVTLISTTITKAP